MKNARPVSASAGLSALYPLDVAVVGKRAKIYGSVCECAWMLLAEIPKESSMPFVNGAFEKRRGHHSDGEL